MDERGRIFEFLQAKGFTSCRFKMDPDIRAVRIFLAREWTPEVNWTRIERDGVPTSPGPRHEHTVALNLLEAAGLQGLVVEILGLIHRGRHEGLELMYDLRTGTRFITAIHSTTLGQPSGGIRRHDPDESELAVLRDTLNLARAMSFKNAAAGLPNGGSKLGVMSARPAGSTAEEAYAFLAFAIDRSGTFTGPDMGYTLEDANRMRVHTKNIVGGTTESGSSGATGRSAAHGVALALQEGLRHLTGKAGLTGRKIAIQGLGQLGGALADRCLEEGAKLLVADVDGGAIDALLKRAPKGARGAVTVVDPEEIYDVKADAFAPCARGGVVSERTVARIQAPLLVPGANNPLRATSQEEELSMDASLAQRGILFLPDWIVNCGGVIHGREEFLRGKHFSEERVRQRIDRVCQEGMRELLERAKKAKQTPLVAAYAKYERTVYRNR
ncbi:MAG: Glu/Leu/Phe/Val dehydrogenase [Planctomycetes bacterium]|nr:Glu/Leu/Phe/Val dehydrogenase [Planctomycetota bacterium]